MHLFATLASDVSDQIGMAAYIYLMTVRCSGRLETLESAADGRLVLLKPRHRATTKEKQEYGHSAGNQDRGARKPLR